MVIPVLLIPIGMALWSLCRAHRILTSKEQLSKEDDEQERSVSAMR